LRWAHWTVEACDRAARTSVELHDAGRADPRRGFVAGRGRPCCRLGRLDAGRRGESHHRVALHLADDRLVADRRRGGVQPDPEAQQRIGDLGVTDAVSGEAVLDI
jgi:hypothetical protein